MSMTWTIKALNIWIGTGCLRRNCVFTRLAELVWTEDASVVAYLLNFLRKCLFLKCLNSNFRARSIQRFRNTKWIDWNYHEIRIPADSTSSFPLILCRILSFQWTVKPDSVVCLLDTKWSFYECFYLINIQFYLFDLRQEWRKRFLKGMRAYSFFHQNEKIYV